jgi:hypothetical protein
MRYFENVYDNGVWVAVDKLNGTWEYMQNNDGDTYMSGGYEVEGHTVVAYDGAYELPIEVIDLMKDLGYIIDL